MGLSKKTFLYSIILAVIMTVFILGYFVLMEAARAVFGLHRAEPRIVATARSSAKSFLLFILFPFLKKYFVICCNTMI